jgi:hypothetical protein
MPSTLTQGSRGTDVSTLQTLLNQGRSGLPPLKVDAIFGPKTLARVLEFQRHNGLKADGIVGPKTWAALERSPAADHEATRHCGTSDPDNAPMVASIQQLVLRGLSERQQRPQFALVSFGSPTASLVGGGLPSIPGLTPFVGSSIDKADVRSTYGSSVDYDRVFFTNRAGLQNRPFTIAAKLPLMPLSSAIQVMNLGPSPSEEDVRHEMAHVWQSQHHSDPFQFMRACVACQGFALAQNGFAAQSDPTLVLKTKQGFPESFPVDAYAFIRGSAFGTYGGEQIAQQVTRKVPAILSHVKTIGANVLDPDNVTSLNVLVGAGDWRVAGTEG